MRRARVAVLGSSLAVAVLGCDLLGAGDDESSDAPAWNREADAPGQSKKSAEKAAPDSPPAEPRGPIERAEKKLYFPAKASTNFGFNLEGLSKLHALAAEIEAPAWSSASDDDPTLARDDDISTAWRCTPTKDARCALGLRLPRPTRLKALRLYALAGPTLSDAREGVRISKLRVHTDEGFVDVPLPDDLTHTYIVLGQPVTTQAVAVEVLETRGKKKGTLHLAELEVYGEDGEPREPWTIDPLRTIVRVEPDPWTRSAGGWALRGSHLEMVEADGSSRRLSTGTALVGKLGDRMLLLERIEHTSCARHEGTFFLVDQKTRVIAPLGALGGAGADIYRHIDGTGFAVGHSSPAETNLHGVMLEAGEYRRKRTPARRDQRAPNTFEAWSLDTEPLRRGGRAPTELPTGCVLGSDDLLAELATALGRRAFEAKPAQWVVCELADDARAYVTARAPCGSKWEIHIVDAARQVVASRNGSGKGTHLRLERPIPELLLGEIGQANGQSEVFRIEPRAITGLGKGTSLALRSPPGCRQTCDDPLPNPHASD